MIIKFNKDRRDGACEYMENGTAGDRNEKDVRIQLTDWDCWESIGAVNEYLKKVGKYDKFKDNYKHIVLSFNKDELTEEKMKAIVNDFVKMYMHAYQDSEYTYYAEVHIPKIPVNERGKKRHGHVHIFLHKYSIELDRRLRFLTHPQRRKEINLIKHYLIKKHGLNYTFRHKAIAKSNIDYYASNNIKTAKQLKESVENYINDNLHNFTNFNDMLQQIERTFNVTIKTSKSAKTPYISISHPNLKRNVRLKGLLFSKKTFKSARESLLNNTDLHKYDEEYFLTLDEIEEQLKERQALLKDEVNERFAKVRAYVAKRKQAAQMQLTLKQLNKIAYKLQILNAALNVNLQVLREFNDVGIFNTADSLKLISKNKNVNISISAQNAEFNAVANGTDTKSEAKILASILADKIKKGEIKKEDVIVTGSTEFKLYVNKYLKESLQKGNIEIGQQGQKEKSTQPQPQTPAANQESANQESVPSVRTESSANKKEIKTIDF